VNSCCFAPDCTRKCSERNLLRFAAIHRRRSIRTGGVPASHRHARHWLERRVCESIRRRGEVLPTTTGMVFRALGDSVSHGATFTNVNDFAAVLWPSLSPFAPAQNEGAASTAFRENALIVEADQLAAVTEDPAARCGDSPGPHTVYACDVKVLGRPRSETGADGEPAGHLPPHSEMVAVFERHLPKTLMAWSRHRSARWGTSARAADQNVIFLQDVEIERSTCASGGHDRGIETRKGTDEKSFMASEESSAGDRTSSHVHFTAFLPMRLAQTRLARLN